MSDIARRILSINPDAKFVVWNDDYDQIVWNDDKHTGVKPTKLQVNAVVLTDPAPTPVVYTVPVIAPDFITMTPPIKDNPESALDEAIAEMEKGHGNPKSIALIALSVAKYLKAKKDKLK